MQEFASQPLYCHCIVIGGGRFSDKYAQVHIIFFLLFRALEVTFSECISGSRRGRTIRKVAFSFVGLENTFWVLSTRSAIFFGSQVLRVLDSGPEGT